MVPDQNTRQYLIISDVPGPIVKHVAKLQSRTSYFLCKDTIYRATIIIPDTYIKQAGE